MFININFPKNVPINEQFQNVRRTISNVRRTISKCCNLGTISENSPMRTSFNCSLYENIFRKITSNYLEVECMQRIVTKKVKNTIEKVCKAYSIFYKAILKAKSKETQCNEPEVNDFQTFLDSLNEEFNAKNDKTPSSSVLANLEFF